MICGDRSVYANTVTIIHERIQRYIIVCNELNENVEFTIPRRVGRCRSPVAHAYKKDGPGTNMAAVKFKLS